jgi:HD-GYP domain-containing protein (c-di-GMP phosphodiesterase class II)
MAQSQDRLTLLQRFTIVSAAIAIGLAVVLSAVTVRAIESSVVKDEAQVAAELILRTIAQQLRPADFTGALPRDRRRLLDSLFLAHGISDRVLRIRLWRADGRMLYSNVSESPGVRGPHVDFSTENGFAEFLEHQGRFEKAAPDVVRFFVPVMAAGNPKPLAAFEIFYDLTHLHAQLLNTRRTVWIAVPLGFLVLYSSVFVLVRRASRRLLKQQADLIEAHLGTYQSLASAIDAKDSYTGNHSTKVADNAAQVAQALRLPPESVEETRVAARLHDLGKIGIPDAILMKAGPLTPEEFATMRKHADYGFEILRKAPLSKNIKLAVLYSHERWDGKGYPIGISGEAIPLIARIISVVDAFEAMTSDRPYRKALPIEEAIRRLEQGAGSQFDPNVARTFIQLVRMAKRPEPPSLPAAASG